MCSHTISQLKSQAVQLLSRHWIIVDANQERKEVRGLGVIGEQPTLAPGGIYKYTSGVVLATPIGTMEGTYQLTHHEGESFDAEIEPFLLSIPHAVH
jgi:ApaG protein